jgi:membrane protein
MQQDRGREAEAPWQITARGWADILYRVWKDTGKKNLSLVAGGVTYYLLLALFPAVAALVSVYGLVADPADMAKSVQSLSGMLPPSTVKLIGDELRQLVSASSKSLGLGAVIGIVIAIWSSVRGMTGMMTALNIAYAQPERRGFIKFNATALVLTVVVIFGGLIALALVAGLPVALNGAGARGPARWVGLVVEWPLLIVFVMGVVALIYRYGPDQSFRAHVIAFDDGAETVGGGDGLQAGDTTVARRRPQVSHRNHLYRRALECRGWSCH